MNIQKRAMTLDPPIALIDFSDPRDPSAPRLRHAFGTPCKILVAHRPDQVRALLDAVQFAARQGAWCVGCVRYEAAGAFDTALQTHSADGPLVWFAVYDAPQPWPVSQDTPAPEAPTLHWQKEPEARQRFDAALTHLQQAIANGEFYQVNYTAQMRGTLHGSISPATTHALFAALQRAQPGGYAACIDMGNEQVLSVSPELFFDWCSSADGGDILTRPMKGTAPRGTTPAQDAAHAAALRTSPKERAENVMIVDLLRNDLSRIAQPHSVQVPALLQTQALPAVWQMTSDVQARTRPGIGLSAIFGALFPCGSITGAPKVRAMQAIHALESGPRGIYCGAIGVVRPAGEGEIRATFNVPIRTVVLRGNLARCGIGSGITSGAQASAEWNEWHYKRTFVEQASMPFDLLETLALEGGQLRHADAHLARLEGAAAHFSYPWNGAQVRECLMAMAQAHPQGLWRVRLLLTASGESRAEAFAMEPSAPQVLLQCATRPMPEAHSEFVRYKTSRRTHYDAFSPTQPGIFDTILYNEEGQITECTRGNVAMLLDGRWVTPALECGLLPGVGRSEALRTGHLSEAVVRLQDIPRVQEWMFLNSLRGRIAAQLV